MATTRQSTLLVNQDWTKLYQAFREADFQSYDFQTLRKAMIDYLRTYYPEDFNDFIESSEYVALIDLIAFLGQSLAFRTDLNARENFIDTAERRDSVLKLARLISYSPKRNSTASGFLKVNSVSTTESLYDSNGTNLTNLVIKWNDSTNINWLEQFTAIVSAALGNNQAVGKPTASKVINGITHDEYHINLIPTTLPVYKFDATIENTSMPFEIVSATTAGQEYVYEIPVRPTRTMGILYKNDNLGNDSVNTGFFLFFKQGQLGSQDFSLPESLPNRVVNINKDNINNSDVWLYGLDSSNQPSTEWANVPAVSGVNIIYNNGAARNSFQVNSRANDQIDLVFGDGAFAAIPQGNYRVYYRQSSGLTYKITPDEMQSISVPISYVSRAGRVETVTFNVSLQYTVANSVARETLDEIRAKAPQQYYTQNRMVTGEDYNSFPYTNFNSVSRVKAINRTSSGVSRYLDVVDATGKYSSTNIFAEDGYLYKENADSSISFTWTTTSDIIKVLRNQILPYVRGQELLHFYYANFFPASSRPDLTDLIWKSATLTSGNSTGYFVGSDGTTKQIGAGVSGQSKYITAGAMVIFEPAAGHYFDHNNEVKQLPSTGILPQNGSLVLYTAVDRLVGNGDTGIQSNGTGPVVLTNNIPNGASAVKVIPAFNNDFSNNFISSVAAQISAYRDFGIRYDYEIQDWVLIDNQNIALDDTFSLTHVGVTTGQNQDASWLIRFTASGLIYTVEIRGLNYLFESLKETKFYFDKSVKVFDPKTGLTVNDNVKILRANGDRNGAPYAQDILWHVYNQVAESDGYVDRSKILLTFADSDNDGIPDNPDIFDIVVGAPMMGAGSVAHLPFVYFKKIYTYGSFVKFVPYDGALVDSDWGTVADLLPHLNEYYEGQLWYMFKEDAFYVATDVTGTVQPVLTTDFVAKVGREGLYFQYRHNSPNYRRIDPSPNNIIDLYLLTKVYETDYRLWVMDTTGKISEPVAPSSEELRIQFNELEKYKSVSDALVYTSAKFKPLFGSKAAPQLQATFKVVKNPMVNLSDSEVKSQVLAFINAYFATSNWDFGETFYFSELAAYLHTNLAPAVASIIIVPNDVHYTYGSLQQITAAPDEILISCATVDDIDVIASITAAQMGLQNQSVNTSIT